MRTFFIMMNIYLKLNYFPIIRYCEIFLTWQLCVEALCKWCRTALIMCPGIIITFSLCIYCFSPQAQKLNLVTIWTSSPEMEFTSKPHRLLSLETGRKCLIKKRDDWIRFLSMWWWCKTSPYITYIQKHIDHHPHPQTTFTHIFPPLKEDILHTA